MDGGAWWAADHRVARSQQGSPGILEWVAYAFSSGSSDPGIEPRSPALQMDSLPAAHLGSLFAWCVYTKNIDM